ncbi:MAG: hypothetical protein IJR07_00230 [Bacteroidaceae bacterium]|nr:hypothetical protein [Bacteroidaceae bacterium]
MENKDKRVLRVELDDDVKKVSITGMNSDEKVVMRKELSEDELDAVAGGTQFCEAFRLPLEYDDYFAGIPVCPRKK